MGQQFGNIAIVEVQHRKRLGTGFFLFGLGSLAIAILLAIVGDLKVGFGTSLAFLAFGWTKGSEYLPGRQHLLKVTMWALGGYPFVSGLWFASFADFRTLAVYPMAVTGSYLLLYSALLLWTFYIALRVYAGSLKVFDSREIEPSKGTLRAATLFAICIVSAVVLFPILFGLTGILYLSITPTLVLTAMVLGLFSKYLPESHARVARKMPIAAFWYCLLAYLVSVILDEHLSRDSLSFMADIVSLLLLGTGVVWVPICQVQLLSGANRGR